MRISTKGRYSLEALLYMALHQRDEHASTRVIADHTGLPEGYLEQLFIPLRRAGIIKGIRGPQGGYQTSKSPEQITVGDILRAAEGRLEPVDCVRSRVCPIQDTCRSRQTWENLSRAINDCVDSISLKDLVMNYWSLDQAEYMI